MAATRRSPFPPARPVRPRRRRRPRSAGRGQGSVVLLVIAVLMIAFAQRNPAQPLQRPEPAAPAVRVDAQVQALLPAGARVSQAVPLSDGSVALAWSVNETARVGLAYPTGSSGYQLWSPATPGRADVAGEASVALTTLPGLDEEVLVATYRTDGCCSWVNLFALSNPPRLLFASPTASSRFLAGRVVVHRPIPGEYPGEAPSDTDVYTWNGQEFALSGTTLAPQHYFPLAARMRWSYRAPGQVIDRWVQETQHGEEPPRLTVRSVARRGAALAGLPEEVYLYGAEGQVRQLYPNPQTLLGPTPGEGSSWQMAGGVTARVISDRAKVAVPAGTFEKVLVVAAGNIRYYYAPHVGLIRMEQNGAPVLELLTFSRNL